MRKVLLFAGMLAASMAAGAATAYSVARATEKGEAYAAPSTEFASNVGTHFTSYEPGSYPDLTYAAENAVKGVVNIVNTQEVENDYYSGGGGFEQFFEFFGMPRGYQQQPQQPRERKSGGSGVIISPDGYIVTNNHVVENATKLRVTLNDNRSFDAKVIGTDPTTDVALIKIDATDLPTIPMGNSDDLRLGEWVLAIGSPFDLRSTITAGIVSAKGRSLKALPSQFSLESFIQTDAAVNPGNSGGALVNTKGELVGINTLIQSRSGTYIGYAFAVPTSIVKKVVVDLKEHGVVQRAMLGIQYIPLTEEFLETEEGKKTGIQEPGGIYVAEVDPEGAAHAAGIRSGDVIVEINGIKIECFLVPGHTWGHMVYLIDDRYLFTGDTIWFGADGGYSFISALAESNKLAVKSLAELEQKLRTRGLRPVILTGHTGWTDDLYFAFAHRDKLCSPFKKKVHDPSAPYDAYDESDDTEENAKRGFLPPVQKI